MAQELKKSSKNVKEIHPEEDKQKRITIDLPVEGIYKPMKRHIVETGESIKDYIINLIVKDLGLKLKK